MTEKTEASDQIVKAMTPKGIKILLDLDKVLSGDEMAVRGRASSS